MTAVVAPPQRESLRISFSSALSTSHTAAPQRLFQRPPGNSRSAGLLPDSNVIQRVEIAESPVKCAFCGVCPPSFQMFIDHMENDFNCIVLVSGDTDLIAPLHYLKKRTGKSVLVFNPHERPSEELRAVSSYYKHIPRDLPAKCQLPDIIPIGTHGRTIHRPPAWS